MNKQYLLRVAAVGVTAAALTVSGASMAAAAEPSVAQGTDSPAPAVAPAAQAWSAKDTTSSKAAKAASGNVGIASVSTFSFKSGVLATSGPNLVRGTVSLTDPGLGPQTIVTSEVRVNNVYRGLARVYPNGVAIPGKYGPGRVVLSNTRVYADGVNQSSFTPKASNAFYFRRDTFGKFKVRHKGKKVTMSVRAQIRGSNGQRASAGRAYIQYAKKGKWKTLKKVKLNSKGNGKYKYSTKSKRKYRLVVKKTTQVQGMTIKLRKL